MIPRHALVLLVLLGWQAAAVPVLGDSPEPPANLKADRPHCLLWVSYTPHPAGSEEEVWCAQREVESASHLVASNAHSCCLHPPSADALAAAREALGVVAEARRRAHAQGHVLPHTQSGHVSDAASRRAAGDCCGLGGCSDSACMALVALGDAFCSEVQWDGLCSAAARHYCTVCGGEPPVPSDNDVCAAARRLTCRGVGAVAAVGDTFGNTDSVPGAIGCADAAYEQGSVSADEWFSVVGDGKNITVSTMGSEMDTYLHVFAACDFSAPTTGAGVSGQFQSFESVVACNDDIDFPNFNVQSAVTFPTTPGAVYRVRVGGYAAEAGTFQISCSGGVPIQCPKYSDLVDGVCKCWFGERPGGDCKEGVRFRVVQRNPTPTELRALSFA